MKTPLANRGMHITSASLLVGLLLLLGADTAIARGDPVAKARALAQEGEWEKSFKAYGKALDKAKGMVDRERIAESLAASWKDAQADANARDLARRAAFAGLIGTKAGAFLSGHHLARAEVLRSTMDRSPGHLAEALKVLVAHGKSKAAGAYSKAFLPYAEGVMLLASEKHAEAIAPLAKAAAAATAERWHDLAMHAHAELLVAHLAGRDLDAATKVLKTSAACVQDASLGARRSTWFRLFRPRTQGSSVADAYQGIIEELGGSSASAKGGAGAPGGAGGSGSGPLLAPLGKALKRWPRNKAIATVERTSAGLRVRYHFDPALEHDQEIADGVKHHNHGGLTLSFFGHGVRVNMADPTGRNGQPGESSHPGDLEFFEPLAMGETWSLYRDGTFRVK